MKDILPKLSEAQLEEKWIKPILQRMGWDYEVQDRLKSGEKRKSQTTRSLSQGRPTLRRKGVRLTKRISSMSLLSLMQSKWEFR